MEPNLLMETRIMTLHSSGVEEFDLRFGRVVVNKNTDHAAYIVGYTYDEDLKLVLKLSNHERCYPSDVSLRKLTTKEFNSLLRTRKYLEMFANDGAPLTRPSII